jgi:hypothetical protein
VTATSDADIPATAPRPAPRTARRVGPVGRYVALVAAISAVLGALWWSGAVAPRARIAWNGSGMQTQGSSAWEVRTIENPGPLPVEVRAARWAPSGLSDPQVRTSTVPALDAIGALQASVPFEPFELGAGERRTIVLAGHVICLPGATEATPRSARRSLEIIVAAPLGPARPLVLTGPDGSGPTLPCPLDAG